MFERTNNDESGVGLKFSRPSLGVPFESLRTNGWSRMIEGALALWTWAT